jgi:hypothetical protein
MICIHLIAISINEGKVTPRKCTRLLDFRKYTVIYSWITWILGDFDRAFFKDFPVGGGGIF